MARIKRLKSKQRLPCEAVTVEERERAAETVIKLLQEEAFPQEMKVLEGGKGLSSSRPLFRLDPILDGGIICVGGRLKRSSLSLKVKHPVILPKEGHITKLIQTHYHNKICHQGRSQTLTEWILGHRWKQISCEINTQLR